MPAQAPVPWTTVHGNPLPYKGSHVPFMRGITREHQKALEEADLRPIFAGLNALGRVPWRINEFVLDVARFSAVRTHTICCCCTARPDEDTFICYSLWMIFSSA